MLKTEYSLILRTIVRTEKKLYILSKGNSHTGVKGKVQIPESVFRALLYIILDNTEFYYYNNRNCSSEVKNKLNRYISFKNIC